MYGERKKLVTILQVIVCGLGLVVNTVAIWQFVTGNKSALIMIPTLKITVAWGLEGWGLLFIAVGMWLSGVAAAIIVGDFYSDEWQDTMVKFLGPVGVFGVILFGVGALSS